MAAINFGFYLPLLNHAYEVWSDLDGLALDMWKFYEPMLERL